MRVLTFGWEFPPAQSGGLGFACQSLTQELLQAGVEVIFVLPKTQEAHGNARFVFADQERRVKIRHADIGPLPYQHADTMVDVIVGYDAQGKPIIRSRTIIEEAHRFAHQAALIAQEEEFDVIHAHDWTSYLAGVAAKIASGKPLILHVHATSFDQAASDNVDPSIYKIEREAFAMADKIVTVSNFTKNIIVTKHGASADRVEVVHNGCDTHEPLRHEPTLTELKRQGKKIVLYHGRITIQKGVDHFIRAARRVVDVDPNVVFVISGSGDMTRQIIEMVGSLGLSQNVLFAGALWYEDRDRMYQSADLIVMPSVSEPFGLVPLEALQHGTPSVITKQSGVAEVLSHALKVDFWDVDEMANQILAALRYPVMSQQIVKEGKWQMLNISWKHAAEKIKQIYRSLVQYVTP
ncbi:MAG: glycosyltransferase family 4 protein [Candidatus Kaiserbacteria bacterium]|nr:glycosyltransferase family 4 protein [Candidatus Kaiserbacteria bacterium]MCB9816197.1 glycosyltransferase family 4 protein [Candidatus Nomurabacteria bacterium]